MISVHVNGQIAFMSKVDQVGVSANSPPPPGWVLDIEIYGPEGPSTPWTSFYFLNLFEKVRFDKISFNTNGHITFMSKVDQVLDIMRYMNII